MPISPESLGLDEEKSAAPARGRTLPGKVSRLIALLRDGLVEYRKAKAAESLYRQLRTMSEEDLAKAGLSRRDIARQVRERLYDR